MFFHIFGALCEQKGESKNAAAKACGLSNSTVTKWKKTQAVPESATLMKLAEHFHVTVDYLLGTTPESYLLGTEYWLEEVERAYAKETDPDKRDELGGLIDALRDSLEDQRMFGNTINKKMPTTKNGDGREGGAEIRSARPVSVVEIPYISDVTAGFNGVVQDASGETMVFSREELRGYPVGECVAMTVKGDSMYPRLLDGDTIIVHVQESVDSGSLAVVVFEDDGWTVKKVVYEPGEDWMDLVPSNPEYKTKRIERDRLHECRVFGLVISLHRNLM